MWKPFVSRSLTNSHKSKIWINLWSTNNACWHSAAKRSKQRLVKQSIIVREQLKTFITLSNKVLCHRNSPVCLCESLSATGSIICVLKWWNFYRRPSRCWIRSKTVIDYTALQKYFFKIHNWWVWSFSMVFLPLNPIHPFIHSSDDIRFPPSRLDFAAHEVTIFRKQ